MAEETNKKEMEKEEGTENVQDELSNQEGGSKEMSLEEQVAEFQDKYMRLYAEFDNYRRRTNKEKVELISSAGEGILKDLLPVMDDFERAIKNNENAEDS